MIGVRTVEGIDLVAKSRPDSERVDAVSVVQRAPHDAGQPVPKPLGELHRVDGRAASVERLVPGGRTRGPEPGAAADFAPVFCDLVRAAPAATQHPALHRDPPAWVD